jgi:hypothetical protein
MFVGQSLDLDWTSNLTCPSVDDYIRMVDFSEWNRALHHAQFSVMIIAN